jgi:PIN domain nuclease of toxin-antitoxin system
VRLLIDTHALIWWLAGDQNLSRPAAQAIGSDAEALFVSAASAWEIATKHRIGKLPSVERLLDDMEAKLVGLGFLPLPVTVRHGERAGALPGPHKDPFDRMLIAQALLEDLILVSREPLFDRYGVQRLW